MKPLTIIFPILDALLAWFISITTVFLFNKYNGVFQDWALILLFDFLMVALFFGVWAAAPFERVSGGTDRFLAMHRAVAFPASIALTVLATLLLDELFMTVAIAPTIKVLGITAILLFCDAVLGRILAPAGVHSRSIVTRLVRFSARSLFATSVAATVGIIAYTRLRSFETIDGTGLLDRIALFIMNDSFTWVLTHA